MVITVLRLYLTSTFWLSTAAIETTGQVIAAGPQDFSDQGDYHG